MKRRGFSLLEMMLVIFLVGLSAGSAMLLFPSHKTISARLEAEAFFNFIKISREDAVIRGQNIGVRVLPDSYQLMLRKNGAWHILDDDRYVTQRTVPNGITTTLELGGYIWASEYESELQRRRLSLRDMALEMETNKKFMNNAPQIWLSLVDSTIPFTLRFSEKITGICWKVSMDTSGKIYQSPCSEEKVSS